MTGRILAILESPFAGDLEANRRYAVEAMRDSISRGESPFASHLLYPAALDDSIPLERALGMDLAWDWIASASRCVGSSRLVSAVYVDRGISSGMVAGIERAADLGIRIDIRRIVI